MEPDPKRTDGEIRLSNLGRRADPFEKTTHPEPSNPVRVLCGLGTEPHVLVMGNDWAAGSELNSLMKKLSKDHSIDTFHYGASFAFGKIEFKRRWPDLDEDALKKIAKAIDGVLKREKE